jgi:oxygen-dependent protoporphyrinogen oxidase
VSVGALVRDRLGAAADAIVDRLAGALLGGVYAGRADRLSVAVTMPGLAAALRSAHTLQAGVRATLALRAPAPGPVFAGIDGGLSRLVDAAAAASGATVRLGRPIAALAGAPGGYRLTLGTVRGTGRGATRAPEWLDVDAVLLAVPSRPASRLLDGIAPAPAALVGELDYASIGLVTYVLPPGALDGTGLDGRSGALVPAVEGRLVKAVTVFSTKWSPQPDGAVLLRVSIGRHGEEAPLRYDDASLAALALDDLGKIAGRPLPAPWHAMVTRLGGALPQYAPGHLDRVARARAGLPATIALAGAAYDGVGIPACIRSGQRAADQLIGALRQ